MAFPRDCNAWLPAPGPPRHRQSRHRKKVGLPMSAEFSAPRMSGARSGSPVRRGSLARSSSLLGRFAAGFGTAAIAFHVWVAVTQSHGLAMSGLMLVMAALCTPCVLTAWRSSTRRAMTMLMVLSLGSACAQLLLVLSFGAGAHSGHSGSTALADAAAAPTAATVHAAFMLIVIALEFVTAAIAAVRIRRLNGAGRARLRQTSP
jgi:hypothetical protein